MQEIEDMWGAEYLTTVTSWHRNLAPITPFFEYPPDKRRIICTTNAIASVNMGLRKVSKARGSIASDDATEIVVLGDGQKWTMLLWDLKSALIRFAFMFEVEIPN